MVIDRNVNSCGHCKKMGCFSKIQNPYEAMENILQFSHMGHLGFGKIVREVCVLLIISEAMKPSNSFLMSLQKCFFNIPYQFPDLIQGSAA